MCSWLPSLVTEFVDGKNDICGDPAYVRAACEGSLTRRVKYIGLSEASAASIRRAHAVHSITAVQIEWSLWSRDVEEEIIPTCKSLLSINFTVCIVCRYWFYLLL
ncbi:hypothetical protein AMTRI_Chr06g200740 [Amborella trichopoda]